MIKIATAAELKALLKLPFEDRQRLKSESQALAERLRARGFNVLSSVYGAVTVEIEGRISVVLLDEARKLLAKN